MHRQTLIPPHRPITGQNQMFVFRNYVQDVAGANIDRHCDKIERLVADAEVPLVRLPACIRAHVHHPVQLCMRKERLRGSVDSTCYPWCTSASRSGRECWATRREGGGWRRWWRRRKVLSAGWQGALLWANVWCPSRRKMARGKKTPESSHYPADLGRNTDCKVTTAGTKKLYFTLYHSVNLLFLILRYVRVCQRAEFDQVLLSVCLEQDCSRQLTDSFYLKGVEAHVR